MIYLLTILFTLSFVFYSKWQFIEARGGKKGKWHPYGFAMRVLPLLFAFFGSSWQDLLLSGSISVIIFEIGINIIALNMPWNYVGSTARTDKMFGKIKWIAMGVLLLAAIVVKIFIN